MCRITRYSRVHTSFRSRLTRFDGCARGNNNRVYWNELFVFINIVSAYHTHAHAHILRAHPSTAFRRSHLISPNKLLHKIARRDRSSSRQLTTGHTFFGVWFQFVQDKPINDEQNVPKRFFVLFCYRRRRRCFVDLFECAVMSLCVAFSICPFMVLITEVVSLSTSNVRRAYCLTVDVHVFCYLFSSRIDTIDAHIVQGTGDDSSGRMALALNRSNHLFVVFFERKTSCIGKPIVIDGHRVTHTLTAHSSIAAKLIKSHFYGPSNSPNNLYASGALCIFEFWNDFDWQFIRHLFSHRIGLNVWLVAMCDCDELLFAYRLHLLNVHHTHSSTLCALCARCIMQTNRIPFKNKNVNCVALQLPANESGAQTFTLVLLRGRAKPRFHFHFHSKNARRT